MKCDSCQEVQFTTSEYADCECGGLLNHVDPFECINDEDYGY